MDFRWPEISTLNVVLTFNLRKNGELFRLFLLLCENMRTKCSKVRNFTTPNAQFRNFRILPVASPPKSNNIYNIALFNC